MIYRTKTFTLKFTACSAGTKESCFSSVHMQRYIKKTKDSKLGKGVKFLIVPVTFGLHASLQVKSEVSSVLGCKTFSSRHFGVIVWYVLVAPVCFASQNHSGTVSLSGFHQRAFCRSPPTAALGLIILTPRVVHRRSWNAAASPCSGGRSAPRLFFPFFFSVFWHFPERAPAGAAATC